MNGRDLFDLVFLKTSSEITVSFPDRKPIMFGKRDGNLFGGTLPKGLPTFLCPDVVIFGCGESCVCDGFLFMPINYTTIRHEVKPIP